MKESVIQPDSNHEQEMLEHPEPGEKPDTALTRIIWTPRFLLIFALTLVLGVSTDSLLASGWSTNLFGGMGQWFILGHVVLALFGWLVLGMVTRSRWIRVGCIFGGVCAIFLVLNVFTHLSGIDPNSPAQSYINVATCTALLGAYIGLSIEGTLLSTWDLWLFFLLPVLGGAGVALTYLLTPQASIITSENAVAAAALVACCLVWWARPSCWRNCPGPTLLFGIVPVIQISMALVNNTMRNFFFLQVLTPRISTYANINNFFFAQFILLCLLLGCMRLTKSEIRN